MTLINNQPIIVDTMCEKCFKQLKTETIYPTRKKFYTLEDITPSLCEDCEKN